MLPLATAEGCSPDINSGVAGAEEAARLVVQVAAGSETATNMSAAL